MPFIHFIPFILFYTLYYCIYSFFAFLFLLYIFLLCVRARVRARVYVSMYALHACICKHAMIHILLHYIFKVFFWRKLFGPITDLSFNKPLSFFKLSFLLNKKMYFVFFTRQKPLESTLLISKHPKHFFSKIIWLNPVSLIFVLSKPFNVKLHVKNSYWRFNFNLCLRFLFLLLQESQLLLRIPSFTQYLLVANYFYLNKLQFKQNINYVTCAVIKLLFVELEALLMHNNILN